MNGKAIGIITYIVVCLLLISAVGVIAYFTNGFSTDFKTIYVKYDNQNLLGDYNSVSLSSGENVFKVSRSLSASKDIEYNVQVSPKVDFSYYVNGEEHRFLELTDLTEFFLLSKNNNEFVISGDQNIDFILQKLYPNQTIEYEQGDIDYSSDMFLITVSTSDAKCEIGFNTYVAITGISISPDNIEFSESEYGITAVDQ